MSVKRVFASTSVFAVVLLFGSTAAWASDGGPETEACCMLDGSCREMPPKDCLEMGGAPQGPGSACIGDWNNNKIDDACEAKWIQPPDVAATGIDVRDTVPIALADDFLCTETGAITRIIVWGSWLHDEYPYDPGNVIFRLMLREDIPDPDGEGPLFSMPGKILWARSYRPHAFRVEEYRKGIEEGYWDPADPESYIFPGDTVCWMYIFDVPADEAFCQQGTPGKPIVYWLDVQATIPPYPGPEPVVFGWKTSAKHWNDDGVWQVRSGGFETPFHELRYPKGHPWEGRSMDLAFALQSEPCVGACCYADGCEITTEAECLASHYWAVWMGPGTNCDDLDGDGVADICEPLFEDACCFPDGSCKMLTPKDCVAQGGLPMGGGTNCTDDVCPPVGACCYDGGCRITTEIGCLIGPVYSVWMGAGTNCDDLDGDGIADICESLVEQACCFPDGSCRMLTPDVCAAAGGLAMGAGTNCTDDICPPLGACCYDGGCRITTELGCLIGPVYAVWMGPGTTCDDLDGDGIADVCETAIYEACCLPDGTCKMLTEKECIDERGEPQGPGSACVGDWNDNKIDDACEAKWIQPPDLARTGIDVDDSLPLLLADDFLCSETNAITRIFVWGSWLNDLFPEDPANVEFTLTIYADVPDPDGTGPLYSQPGERLWSRQVKAYDFAVRPFQEKIEEGFWDPVHPDSYIFPGDTVCWLYIFDIPADEAFCQKGSPDKPIVYWLGVQATPGPSPYPVVTLFGWKSSTRHWNDDAVFCQSSGGVITPWRELRYPKGHPWAERSMDLAFALEAEPCVGTPAEPEDK
jgi:hypothetical protein